MVAVQEDGVKGKLDGKLDEVHFTRLHHRDPETYPNLQDLVDLPELNNAEIHQK